MNKQSPSQMNIDEQCIANLKGIYRLIKLYLHHSGGALGFPAKLDEFDLMTKNRKLFICPADKQTSPRSKRATLSKSYEIVNDPLKPELSGTPPGKIAIIAEKNANHDGKRFVLFYDGSVRGFGTAEFAKLKNSSFVDY